MCVCALKQLIVINRIQKFLFVCVFGVYLLCIYKYTHTCSIYFDNIYMYLHVYLYYK